MNKKCLLGLPIAFLMLFGRVYAQDVAVINITGPTSACSMTSTESVVVKIFNYGPLDLSGVNIPVNYTINGGASVNEVANFPSFLANSTVTYTFTTVADLSVAGTYTLTASTALAGDSNPTNDAVTGYNVTNTSSSVGGTVSGGTNVCVSGNSGNLTLSGNTGNVLNWEYSTDGGSTWINISNTTTTQSYNNLTVPTDYRAVVQNGSCASATSSLGSMTIDQVTVGGTTNSTSTVCQGTNVTVTVSGKTGSVQNWQYSTDNGVTWNTVANTTTSYNFGPISSTTKFRATIQNGACSAATSSIATKTVNPTTVGGTLTPATATECSGSNNNTITLSGQTGTISRWEYSTNGGSTWTNIANTTTSDTYTNLTTSTQYRALVKSGVCPAQYSSISDITVTAATVAGTVTANATECSGSNSGNLTLSGEAGSVLNWEYSTNGGSTWTSIANTTNTQTYTNLTTTTKYRAVVQAGSCPSGNSTIATITVNPNTVGGTLSSNATVCASSNNGTITLSGKTGNVQSWEYSTDNGTTWTSVANTTTSLDYSNLTDTTLYRTVVKSGVCPSDYSDTVTITVDPVTVAGVVNSNASICSGMNSGSLTLTGNTGSVQNWEYSTDGGNTWVNIVNATTTQTYNNISTGTIYHALVKSGVCAQAYSSVATLSVDPQAVGGTTYGTTTVCEGSNSGSITLVGYSTNISAWESSTDGGVTWTPEAGTSAVLNYTNLAQNTMYHAISSSGVCPDDTSSVTTISVDAVTVGGVVSLGDTVCAGSNGGTLTLAGNTGNVVNWEYSTDGGNTWVLIANTTSSQNYANINTSTYYRASVKNGVCPSDVADSVYIKVDSTANAGVVSSPAQLCISNANGTLSLSGNVGSVVDWEASTDNGATWTGAGNTSNTLNYSGLTDTTYYRVIVNSGVCGNDTSSVTIIGVDQLSVAGVLGNADTVCATTNGDTLAIAGYTGNITGWEYSTNNGATWMAISNTNDSLVYVDLGGSTIYHASVQNGVCPSVTTNNVKIVVDPATNAGIISGGTIGCEMHNAGTLHLSNATGLVTDWIYSTDNGTTWQSTGSTGTNYSYVNIPDTTMYQAIVKSGVCNADTTSEITILVYPAPVVAFTVDTVCLKQPTHISNLTTISSGFISTYTWDYGDGTTVSNMNQNYTYATADTFMVKLVAFSNFGCSDTATAVAITKAIPSAQITYSLPLSFCPGDSTVLSFSLDTNSVYSWSTADTTMTIMVDSSNTYVLTVTDTITGCFALDSVSTVKFMLDSISAGVDTSISINVPYMLNAYGNGVVSWTPADYLDNAFTINPMATIDTLVTFVLQVTDANSCVQRDSVTLSVVLDYTFDIKNLITPNGDGINDKWEIKNIQNYPDNTVTVFNREGNVVFQTTGYTNDWEGTYNGAALPDGAYFYIVKFDGNDKVFKGDINILRNK